jgi:hypothetical protein
MIEYDGAVILIGGYGESTGGKNLYKLSSPKDKW